jgi:long-chain fatty acid transport protein
MFTYGDLEFKLAVPPGGNGRAKLDGDDIAVGYTLGALVELGPQTRVGVSYLSEQNFEFEGDLEINPLGLDVGSDTDLDLAQVVRVGAYHEFNDQWAVLGTVGWEDWSTLSDLFIATDGKSVSIPRNWDDTYHYSIGAHYKPTPEWLLQTGFTYDSSPVDSVDRTADMPMDRQLRLAVGAQYQFSDEMTFGGALEYVDFGEANIKNNNTLIGDYETNRGIFFQLNLNWKL